MDPRVRVLVSYLVNRCDKELSMCDLSRLVNLSESHLSHLFRSQTGMSPQKFLKVARMRRAAQLLETTFLSVKEVMANVGYNDPSHFVRDFKKLAGESPSKYRQNHFHVSADSAAFANRQQKQPTSPDCNLQKRRA